MKLKEIPNLMIEEKCINDPDTTYNNILRQEGFNEALSLMSEREIKINEDKAYAEFSSHQRKHDCPGFDCAICYEAFQATIANLGTILEAK